MNYKECENFFCSMCKVRDNTFRICVLPRCCGICSKRVDNDCDGVCLKFKEFNSKDENNIKKSIGEL